MDIRYLLLVLALLIIVGLAIYVGHTDPISAQIAQANVTSAVPAALAPAADVFGAGLAGALARIFLTSVVVAIAGLLISQIRKRLAHKPGAWLPGPNAQYRRASKATPQQQFRQPGMSFEQKLLLSLLSQQQGDRPIRPIPASSDLDDEDFVEVDF